MSEPLTSVIVLNWNGKEHLKECISGLMDQTYKDFEIIFVDNCSDDGSVRFVEEYFPAVKIIQNKIPLGFAEGTNIGIENAKGKYIATLNNDTKVEENWLAELVKAVESDEKIGMCASKMLFYHDSSVINSTGILVFKDGRSMDRGFNEPDEGQYDGFVEVFGPCAGAALYKKEMLGQVGLFDPDYFAYLEDVDLAWRSRLAGWKCLYVPTAVVYHKHGATSDRIPSLRKYYVIRNRAWNILKNFPLFFIVKYMPWIIFWQIKSIPYFLLKKEFNTSVIKANIDILTTLPHISKKRKEIQSQKTISDNEIRKWLLTPPILGKEFYSITGGYFSTRKK